ncbi:hypothetical protein MYCTH_97184 [Thermothelomyces thermophilus ATCC 42464]|uniref:Uncharacterized protein n=1 Tax=Thermothelomyces thermophilus (strain ATCC 42464 / BCRC 31852 / DSM 1799) TaxID=573729 RepID=G2QKV4_THET4|nr:uncharacterized protein MYCTH_97184 [Thermothelomyces thermophilus ATCC 42464]AEO60586.1 hypothetical protein MYCTH_97184 [Thermothelomyces thermophilus ATCC 42464]
MSEPSKKPEPVQPQPPGSGKVEFTNNLGPPFKRPVVEDEIEFISCSPVKKKRLTEQTTAHNTTTSTAPPQLQDTRSANQETRDFPQIPPAGRCRSLCGIGIGQAKAPGPETAMESRGTSLPVLEKFAFPQTFPLATGRPPRLSDAISPKQFPQASLAPPETGTNTATTISTTNTSTQIPTQESSVTLDQISCLDFDGVPTNSPGFDAGRVFSADCGIMSGISVGNTTSAMPPLPPFPTSSPRAGIPFTMYSTGSIMTVPQAQNRDKPSVAVLPTGAKLTSCCPHCARIRQQNTFRQAPVGVSGMSPKMATQTHGHANPQGHEHASSPRSVPPPPGFSPPGHIIPPRSAPAPGQEQRRLPNQWQHQNQQPPSENPLHPGPPTPNYYLRPLLQDMAQTIQASFPYAQVAARHGMAPARVAEVLARVVGAPLVSRRE